MTTDSISQTPNKTCTKCKKEYHATNEYFAKHKKSKSGLRPECKKCVRLYYQANRTRILEYAQSNREHRREYMREWHNANAEYERDYRLKNRERISEYCRKYRIANRERINAHAREYNLAHRDYKREWQIANRERISKKRREYRMVNSNLFKLIDRVHHHRRRALKQSSTPEGEHFTVADERLQYRSQKGKCWHCYKKIVGTYHVDHLVPLAKGGTNAPNNIVISCPECNLSKGAKTVAEWKGKLL